MIIVAGHLIVDPSQRPDYLDTTTEVITSARTTDGCLDFSITADPIEPNRINVYERWNNVEAVEAFRGSGPSDQQQAQILSADVTQYEIADSKSLT